jgi:hypothetical protein
MVLGRRNVGGSSAGFPIARSLSELLAAIAHAVVADAFKSVRRFNFLGFVWVIVLSFARLAPIDVLGTMEARD